MKKNRKKRLIISAGIIDDKIDFKLELLDGRKDVTEDYKVEEFILLISIWIDMIKNDINKTENKEMDISWLSNIQTILKAYSLDEEYLPIQPELFKEYKKMIYELKHTDK